MLIVQIIEEFPNLGDNVGQFKLSLSNEQYSLFKEIKQQERISMLQQVNWSETKIREMLMRKTFNSHLIKRYHSADLFFKCISLKGDDLAIEHPLMNLSAETVATLRIKANNYRDLELYPLYIDYLNMIDETINNA